MSLTPLRADETPVDYARDALACAANYVSMRTGIDPLALYDVRGSTEETRWRHTWIYLTRVALDIPEADIAAGLTAAMIDLGLRSAQARDPAPKPAAGESEAAFAGRLARFKARPLEDKPLHHDTIANACHHIEDLMSDGDAASELERMGEVLLSEFVYRRQFRERMDEAWARLASKRKRSRKNGARA